MGNFAYTAVEKLTGNKEWCGIMSNKFIRFIKYFIILPLCLLMWSCLDYISIGDYEEHLEAWNRMGLLDYKLSLSYRTDLDDEFPQKAIIIVKNGIPESSDPPSWLTRGEKSTIPDFYSFIKNEEKRLQKVKHLKKVI